MKVPKSTEIVDTIVGFPILRGRLLKVVVKRLTVTAHRFPILRGRLLK